MIQTMTGPQAGVVLYQTGGPRRRKGLGFYGLLAVIAMAGSGAVVGGLQERMSGAPASAASTDAAPTGPFAYFPR